MAGKFEAPKGQKGNIPKRTSQRPSHADINKMPPLRPEQPSAPGRQAPRVQKQSPAPAVKPVRRRRKQFSILPIVLSVLALVVVIGLIVGAVKLAGASKKDAPASPAGSISILPTTVPETTAEPTTVPPEPEHVVATASIGTVGDLLMHKPILDNYRSGSGWDFSDFFRYVAPYISEKDWAVGNLETTFGGDGFPYQGNPAFNTPDIFAQNVKNAGFDMLLTVNNHCYDTLMTGVKRSLEVSREAGLKTIGTRLSEDEKRYEIVEINGIRIGMIAYSYSHARTDKGVPRMNVNTPVEQPSLVNFFYQDKPDDFYAEVEPLLAQMRQEGAEAIMFFIHWGVEYQLSENATQDAIAQKLCDMGVDVIVGGHPHVVQPMQMLTSNTDVSHKTMCIYSLGNFVSNQRLGNISSVSTAHTEDGAMFTVTFEKYSDGTVYVSDVDLLPTWVNMYIAGGKRNYDILPLDDSKRDTWQTDFSLTDAQVVSCRNSYSRTMNIVGGGLNICKNYLQSQKDAREEYYYDLAWHPEKYEQTTPAETLSETTLPDAA